MRHAGQMLQWNGQALLGCAASAATPIGTEYVRLSTAHIYLFSLCMSAVQLFTVFSYVQF